MYTKLIRSDLIFYDLFVQDLQQGYEVVKPSLTFSDTYTLDLGDLTLELIFFGKGHSNSDILIYVPQERVLVSGAIAYQQYRVPEIGEESHLEDVHRFLAVLDRLLADKVKIEHVIPGHSVPLTRAALPPIRDYYQRMLKEVASRTPARSDPGPDDQASDPPRQVPRLPRPTPRHVWRRPPGAQREEPLAHPERGPALAAPSNSPALTQSSQSPIPRAPCGPVHSNHKSQIINHKSKAPGSLSVDFRPFAHRSKTKSARDTQFSYSLRSKDLRHFRSRPAPQFSTDPRTFEHIGRPIFRADLVP